MKMIYYKKEMITGIIVLIFLIIVLCGVTFITPNVFGNVTNGTTKTYVNVTNTEPFVYRLVITPDPVILSPGGVTNVTCIAYVMDYNGWMDINNGTHNATFYDIDYSWDSPDDKNYHYTNQSCGGNCTPIVGSSTNATCNCTFEVYYFANDTTWICNFSVSDGGGAYYYNETRKRKSLSANNYTTTTIDPLIAINVPSEIDYGELAATENSSMKNATLTNYGNIPFNVTVEGWGGANQTTGQGLAMMCWNPGDGTNVANISVEHEKYSAYQNALLGDMINLSSSSVYIGNFSLYQRLNDTNIEFGYDQNNTYWRIYIPPGTRGFCNGTIMFTAQPIPGEPGAP